MGRFKMPPQIFRLVLLAVGIVSSYVIARQLLTPASFQDYGFYRGAALEEMASLAPVYAGSKACEECHSDTPLKLAKGDHKTLSCEGCHGISLDHANNPDITPKKLTGSYCTRCHEANPSRPAWFHQITIKDHYTGKKCTECHMPHQPNEVP
jgi:hypothetical protein